ncbi:type VI secretion system tip protein VgrG [Sphingobium rhizovicinum]|uniref:Type VI secretion system tip protein VgrG n=1 Tax=Sphingobium rhizovicinum TaxID=432308 RepID=A0ABV7NMW3_9SPHN
MTEQTVIPTPATPDVCTPAILIDGKELPGAFHMLAMTIVREANRIPSASIQFDDGDAAKATFAASSADEFAPGKSIEIQLGYRSQNKRVFKGVIVRQQIRIRKGAAVLSVDCYAEAVKMIGARRSRYFLDKKDSDIIDEVLGEHGLSKDVETTQPQLREVVQYDCTDWDFLLCRADANGLVALVEDDKVRFAKPAAGGSPALSLVYGATVLELDAEMDARWQSKAVRAEAWKAADQAVLDADASEPATPAAGNVSAADLAKILGDDTDLIIHGGAIDQAELQSWADARLQRMRLARLRGRARCQGFADMLPGLIVEISGIGERFSGNLYVSGVRHSVSAGNWETDVQFGLGHEGFAETHDLRPLPAAGMLPAVSGLQIGVVTALEKDPDGEDRIRCRLPLISAQDDGVWARITTLDAGKDRGTFFRPEIDDEVVVGFLSDDPRHPVILGMVHSSAKPAPEPAEDTNHHKGYVSREKMKLTFDDEKKVVLIETPAGNRITLSEDAKGIKLEDQNKNRIILDDSGILIESAKDLTFKAAGDVKLSGANAEFSAQSAFKASGASTAELSGAQTKVNGDAMTVIKGGMVQIN